MTRKLTAALALSLVAWASAACGGSGDDTGIATAGAASAAASAGPSAGPSAGGAEGLSNEERQLRFAECMRENGVDLPDPEPGQQGTRLRFGRDTDPEKVEAALEACRQYTPGGGQGLKLNPEQLERLRQFSRCMRDNGVPEFPDPSADGGIRIRSFTGLDPDSPQFKAAEEQCRHLRPGPARSGTAR